MFTPFSQTPTNLELSPLSPHTDTHKAPNGTHAPLPAMPTQTPPHGVGQQQPQQPQQPQLQHVQQSEKLPVNFDLFSNKAEIDMQLAAVEARMRELHYDEQKIQVRSCVHVCGCVCEMHSCATHAWQTC